MQSNRYDFGVTKYKPSTLYIMANISPYSPIHDAVMERRKLLIGNNTPTHSKLHITLLQIELNKDHPYFKNVFWTDPMLYKMIRRWYIEYFSDVKLFPTDYNLYGKYLMKRFFAKRYTCDTVTGQVPKITQFRTEFYKYINERLKNLGAKTASVKYDKEYYVYIYDGQPLFAVPEFYHGIGKWDPHISIIHTNHIQEFNQNLYDTYVKALPDRKNGDDVTVLTNKLVAHNIKFMNLNMKIGEDIENLTMNFNDGSLDIQI